MFILYSSVTGSAYSVWGVRSLFHENCTEIIAKYECEDACQDNPW